MKKIAVIGGGPAGLRAAEIASAAGLEVTLFEAKRSVGRKFLVAGKGGFNITHAEPLDTFVTRYSGPQEAAPFWHRVLAEFDNKKIRGWAARLDVGTFVASSGRVYPKALKAAPLLRAWVRQLKNQGVSFQVKHRLIRIESQVVGAPYELAFETEEGPRSFAADAVILALGGGSWPMTGSDGSWTSFLEEHEIVVRPLTAANCGWEVEWSAEVLASAEGEALKNLVITSNGVEARGELVVTKYGLEGGPIYQLGPAIKAAGNPEITIDFKPSFTVERLVAKMESARRHFLDEAQVRWKLSPPACEIIESLYGPFNSAEPLAEAVKNCRIPLIGPRPIAEAISSAGGVSFAEVDEGLMLHKLPGVFVAGEMLDWEAPTGGYLMQGCFSTGTLVGRKAVEFLS